LYFVNFPEINIESENNQKSEKSIWSYKHLVSGSLSIFFYVGAEVAIGSFLILYMKKDLGIAEQTASSLVAYYWGSAMIGRLIGSAIGQKVDSHKMLAFVTSVAMFLVFLAVSGIFTDTIINVPAMVMKTDPNVYFEFPIAKVPLSVVFLVVVGLFNSVMWPCIFPLGINKLGSQTSAGSGLMVTMVAGGAFIPLIQGFIADQFGFMNSFLICIGCYGYILYFALKGYKTDYLEK